METSIIVKKLLTNGEFSSQYLVSSDYYFTLYLKESLNSIECFRLNVLVTAQQGTASLRNQQAMISLQGMADESLL